MPVLGGLRLALDTDDLRRRALGRRGKRFEGLLREIVGEAEDLIDPRIAYELFSVEEIEDRRLILEGGWALEIEAQSPCLPLEGVERICAMAGTLGPGLERKVSELFARGQRLKAVILDGVGSALVDALMDLGWEKLEAKASSEGLGVSGPLSPGMPGLALEVQEEILKRVPAEAIGLGMTSGGVLVPRKSFTCVIFMGKGMKRWQKGEMCRVCPLREACTHRRTG